MAKICSLQMSTVNCQSTQVVAKAGLEPWTDCTKGHTAASVPQLMSKAVQKVCNRPTYK